MRPFAALRRAAMCLLGVGMAAGPALHTAHAAKPATANAGAPAAADAASGANAAAAAGPVKPAKATLTVRVTGQGKPVAGAEVKVTYASGAEEVRATGADGSVTLSAATSGAAKVRVIAQGWDSKRESVDIKAGQTATLSIALKPQADPR